MAFEKKVPEWNAAGSEPPASLKSSGFTPGYKPPADYFNWFWHGVSEALKELQDNENLKTYTSLAQIGLSEGSETIASIVERLPEYSTLFMNVGTSNANIYPVAYGALYVMKRDHSRTFFEFLEKTSARRYFGVYDSTMSTPWSGWEKFSTATELNAHLNNKNNPHAVTKTQVGLGNVPNVATNDQTPTYSDTNTLTTLSSGEKLNVAFQKIKCAINNLITHIGSHKLQTYISFADIGLTIGSETIEGIATNLPDNSQLFVVVGADGADIYPVAYGVLHVYKKNTTRTYFEFLEKTSARRYYGVYDSTLQTPWTGWGKTYSEHCKPTPADIGAIPHINAKSTDYNMDDVLKSGSHCAFYETSDKTLGTPSKYGVTGLTSMSIFSFNNGYNYGVQVAFAAGMSTQFVRNLHNGVMSDWTTGYLPLNDPAGTGSFSMNRKADTDLGSNSIALGRDVEAIKSCAVALGCESKAHGLYSVAIGHGATASGQNSVAIGYEVTASGQASYAEGRNTTSSNQASHAEGSGTTASGQQSHAEGLNTNATGTGSHAEGVCTTALNNQHAQGHYNDSTIATGIASVAGAGTGTAFVIGNGSEGSLSNAFRVTYNGVPYAKSSLITTGCDYAEFFEWLDGNPDAEDRRGYFVTLDGEKIRKAKPGDYILGIVSGQPSVIGNGDESWMGRYIMDEFGAFVYEPFEYEEEVTDPETGEITTVKRTGTKYKENPDYDPSRGYIQRSERPEWSAVGMLGVLSVWDDGTCEVNGYCEVTEDGTATKADAGYRVIKRVNENIVKIVFR